MYASQQVRPAIFWCRWSARQHVRLACVGPESCRQTACQLALMLHALHDGNTRTCFLHAIPSAELKHLHAPGICTASCVPALARSCASPATTCCFSLRRRLLLHSSSSSSSAPAPCGPLASACCLCRHCIISRSLGGAALGSSAGTAAAAPT